MPPKNPIAIKNKPSEQSLTNVFTAKSIHVFILFTLQ